jgi:hypothetical protein
MLDTIYEIPEGMKARGNENNQKGKCHEKPGHYLL